MLFNNDKAKPVTKTKKNIIIVGCGKVGSALAEQLSNEDNNITVIDTDKKKLNDIVSRFGNVVGVEGNGATHLVQRRANISHADLLIAVTGSDELNLLCCLVAKREGKGNCETIARVRNPDYSNSTDILYLQRELGIAMVINPEYAAADEIARVLRFPSAIKIDRFAGGKVELLKFKVPEGSSLIGRTVRDAIMKDKCDVLFCTVERDDEAFIVKGDFVFAERDVISIIASPANAKDFFHKIGYKMYSVKDAIIVGGGNITHYLCKMLIDTNSGIELKVIEKDSAKALELSENESFRGKVRVINGDTVNKDVLKEEGIENAEAFVAMTSLDEENIFLSLYAKNVSKAKIVTKITRLDYDEVIKHLDLDSIIYPKNITSDMIARYVRAMKRSDDSNVRSLSNIINGQIEAAEFAIKKESRITEKKIAELQLKDDVLISAIFRNGKPIIPHGDDIIKPGDSVVVVSKILALHDISEILI